MLEWRASQPGCERSADLPGCEVCTIWTIQGDSLDFSTGWRSWHRSDTFTFSDTPRSLSVAQQLWTETEAEVEAETETEAEVEAETETETEVEAETEAEVEAETKAEIEIRSEIEAEIGSETEVRDWGVRLRSEWIWDWGWDQIEAEVEPDIRGRALCK